jgi:formylglycine-generating enzyme required for sulfatase activity
MSPGQDDVGYIQIQLDESSSAFQTSSNTVAQKASAYLVASLDVQVINKDGDLIKSVNVRPSPDGYFRATIEIKKLQDDLKVLCIGYSSAGKVVRCGYAENIDLKSGKKVTANILYFNLQYSPPLLRIAPNPSVGDYTVSWTSVENADRYILEESTNNIFAGSADTTIESLSKPFSDKQKGLYYYRIRAVNSYNIKTEWSAIDSVVVGSQYNLNILVNPTDGGITNPAIGQNSFDADTVVSLGAIPFTGYQFSHWTGGVTDSTSATTTVRMTDNKTVTANFQKKTYNISGIISGVDGVIVDLSGSSTGSQTVNNGGSYSFTIEHGGTYTITPSKTGFQFAPSSKTFPDVTSNQTQNFTASVKTVTLSGTISGANGVTVTLTGDSSGTQLVNDGGTYSFTVAHGGIYSVTPTKTGYSFAPSGKTFTNVTVNQTQNFTASINTYTLSGFITGADGVTVTLSGSSSGSQVVNSGGTYSFTVEHGSTYTITPSKAGNVFTPATFSFSNVASSQVQNFTATPAVVNYSISGTVTGAGNVTVTLSGDASGSQTVNSEGYYTFTITGGGSYVVTPSKTGYTFTPESQTITGIASNQTCNFTATPIVRTISGIVSGTDNVTMTLTGDITDTQVVNDGGTYTFTVPYGGGYTVTPTKTGYVFSPEKKVFSSISTDQQQNFTATVKTYTVSGIISGANNVTVTLSGDATGSKMVNNGGSYSFEVVHGGNFTITPSVTGYLFTPSSTSYDSIATNQIQNFAAEPETYTISGTITGTDGVTVYIGGDSSGSQIVNSGGNYSFTVQRGGSYTVLPSKAGCLFTPASKEFNNVAGNLSQNFTASPITFTISGIITGADAVTVTLSGGGTGSQIINDGGSYSFTVSYGGTYTVTPTKSGYTFSPGNQTFTNITANQVRNFTASPIIFTISGIITGADALTVTLSGGGTGSQIINDGGSYSFTVSYGGTYIVTPTKSGYTILPGNQTFTNITGNQVCNFVVYHNFSGAMVSIPGGTFQMGDVENAGGDNEKPVHTVTVSGFEMGIYEITNAQYRDYLNLALASGDIEVSSGDVYGITGSWSGNRYLDIGYGSGENMCWITYNGGVFSVTSGYENRPVIAVTWYGAKSFANYYGLDIPTEAEWEYACRGGNQYKYGTNDGMAGSSKGNYASIFVHPVNVGNYPANPFGLFDMFGNVMEFCNDWYDLYTSESMTNPTGPEGGSAKIGRGGAYVYADDNCRSAYRSTMYANYLAHYLGFRVVRRPGGLMY